MHGALPGEFPELTIPAPGTEFLAVVFFHLRETRLTHPAWVVVFVHTGVVRFL